MRKLTALLLSLVMLLTMVMPVAALTNEEVLVVRHWMGDQIKLLQTANKMSNDEIYSVWVDLSHVPQGSVSAVVYENVYEQVTIANYADILNQPIEGTNGAYDKVTRFWFYLDNNDDNNFVSLLGTSAPENTIVSYVYGTTKAQTITSFISGIPECLANTRLYDNSGSNNSSSSNSTKTTTETTVKPAEPEWAAKYLKASFALNDATYVFNDKTETMDVAPYAKDNRTYVPVRYLAYSLGVAPEGIAWNQESQTVTVSSGGTTVNMTIGSNIMTVNGTPTTMDVAPEAVDGRTMLPARYLAEALGATVTWNATTNSIEITKAGD
jgi:hypothetical protein